MRRFVVLLTLLSVVMPAGAVRSAAEATVPLLPRPCTPEGPMDVVRPVGCQRILYKYGPLHVTPGDNLILVGPVTIERPLEDGWVVRFKPNLERLDGSIPSIEILHLHHAVWLSTSMSDPMFASGEEKTTLSVPNGYGLPVKRTGETWLLNYMLHNQTPVSDNVFITYEIDFIPAATVAPGSVTAVTPYWLDTGGFNGFNPVYNQQRGYGSLKPGECAFPKEQCAAFDPYGKTVTGNGRPGNGVGLRVDPPDGTIVFMAGHLHPGGLRNEVQIERGSNRKMVFVSDAVYYDPNGPVSWDMSMEVTKPDYRLRISPGDRLILNSIYDTKHGSWYEAMGIVITYLARNDFSGPDPFASPVDPHHADVTHGHMPEASRYGGPDRGTSAPAGERVLTDTILIGGFAYLPGNGGTTGVAMPAARAGDPLTFVNLDAAGSIFHTVTECKAPCDGGTGISYPLANGAKDFDSLELGIGPPGFTAAANRVTWDVDTAAIGPGVYTYFCRVHPFMRGAFEILP